MEMSYWNFISLPGIESRVNTVMIGNFTGYFIKQRKMEDIAKCRIESKLPYLLVMNSRKLKMRVTLSTGSLSTNLARHGKWIV